MTNPEPERELDKILDKFIPLIQDGEVWVAEAKDAITALIEAAELEGQKQGYEKALAYVARRAELDRVMGLQANQGDTSNE